MGTVLYKVDKNSGEVHSIFVSGIDQNVKGYIIQNFTCTHGSWSAFYNNGVVTYPRGDWRHNTSREMELHLGFTFKDDEDFEYFKELGQGYYNYVIYRFEKDVLGLHRGK